jgi:SAM-dependent methyltransferase
MSEETRHSKDAEDWQRRQKWMGFYYGTFSPHLPPDQEASIESLPWRSHQASPHLLRHLAEVGLSPSARVCEMGCGTGENLLALAHHAAFTLGVDIVPKAVEAASAALAAAGLSGCSAVVCEDILALLESETLAQPAPDGGEWAFDFIFDCQTLHCIRKVAPRTAAQVYATLLRPGGTMLVLTGNADEAAERGPERLTREEVLSLFTGTPLTCEGLRAARFEWTDAYRRQPFDDPPLAWVSLWRNGLPHSEAEGAASDST